MIEVFDRDSLARWLMHCNYAFDFRKYVESRYFELERELLDIEDFASNQPFSLKEYGYLVILEKKDNLRDLNEIGLNSQDSGIFGAIAETTERFRIDGLFYIELCIIYNNSFMMIFLLREQDFRYEYPELKTLIGRADEKIVLPLPKQKKVA